MEKQSPPRIEEDGTEVVMSCEKDIDIDVDVDDRDESYPNGGEEERTLNESSYEMTVVLKQLKE